MTCMTSDIAAPSDVRTVYVAADAAHEEFVRELRILLNRCGMDSYAGTPDHVLAACLVEQIQVQRKTRIRIAEHEGATIKVLGADSAEATSAIVAR